jgi:hypothetical protein
MSAAVPDIWQDCQGNKHVSPVSGIVFRLIENQGQVATLSYVDPMAEQSALGDLLDGSKPIYPKDADLLPYLLKTPFRYPSLPWGSRFGQPHQTGIFYGGGGTCKAKPALQTDNCLCFNARRPQ